MGSTNIKVQDEAYEFLSSRKSRGQSFSGVILELKDKIEDDGR